MNIRDIIKLSIVAAVLVFIPTVMAEEHITLTLSDVIRMAFARDVKLVLAQERINQALARIGQSRAPLLPQLDVAASQKRLTRDLRSSGISIQGDPLVGPINVFDARVQLTQTIFDPAAMNRLKAAQAGSELSYAQLRKTKEDVLALVATMFIQARRDAQGVKYTQAVMASEGKKLNVAKGRVESGSGTDIELKQAQAGYDAAVRQKLQAANAATNSRLDLLAALGLELDKDIKFADNDNVDEKIPNENPTADQMEKLPEWQAALQQVKVSERNHSMEKSEFLPKISAMADYGPSGLTPSEENETYTLGVSAKMPIFDGGLRQSRVKEAESQVRADEAVLADTERQVKAGIIKARESFTQAQAFVAETASKRRVAEQQVAVIKEQRDNGTASDLDWLQALAQDAQALNLEQEAKANLLTARINWAHVLGKMEEFMTDQPASVSKE